MEQNTVMDEAWRPEWSKTLTTHFELLSAATHHHSSFCIAKTLTTHFELLLCSLLRPFCHSHTHTHTKHAAQYHLRPRSLSSNTPSFFFLHCT